MKKKGFTLIEVIAAVVIVSIIVAGFMTMMNGNYKILIADKQNFADINAAQSDLHHSIKSTRNDLDNGSLAPNLTVSNPFNLISQIGVYQLEKAANNKKAITWVCKTPDFNLNKPKIGDVELLIMRNSTPVEYPNLADCTGLTMFAETSLLEGSRIEYSWYSAKVDEHGNDFNIPIYDPSEITESEWGVRYPQFPSDYNKMPIVKWLNEVDVIPEYQGTFFIVTAQPFDDDNNAGDIKVSNPIFFLRLPEGATILSRFDASNVDFHNRSETTEPEADGTRRMLSWRDLAYELNKINVCGKPPHIYQTPLTSTLKAQYITFHASTELKINDIATANTFKKFFLVTKDGEGDVLLKNGDDQVVGTAEGASGAIKITTAEVETLSGETIVGAADFSLYEMLVYDNSLGQITPEIEQTIIAFLKDKYQIPDN